MSHTKNKIVSVAPMMDWTDRHCRYFHRLIAPSVTLYTEMVTTGALIHGDRERFLRFNQAEHPVVLQLGGSDPEALATSAKMGEEMGYDEINLNCGCPSDRVQSGAFGAILMKDPERVRDCILAMKKEVSIPVTVKCRIGVDDCEDLEFLTTFIQTVQDGDCDAFIVHARKAWLNGLSPKENREVPPLQYDLVREVRGMFPDLNVQLNGGVKVIEDTQAHLENFDGVMIGREAYQNPWFLQQVEKEVFGTEKLLSECEVIERMVEYIEQQQRDYDTPIKSITRHMTGMFKGQAGGRRWRQTLSTEAHKVETRADFLLGAMPEGV